MGGASIQDNIYNAPNNWVGYLNTAVPVIYKFTYYTPSSNNPWYGDTNYTINSWRVETISLNNIELSKNITIHYYLY